MDKRAKGNSKEAEVLKLHATLGKWNGWRPGKAMLFLPARGGRPARFIGRPQDIWGAGDIILLRSGSPVLLIQVGAHRDAAHKRQQVLEALKGYSVNDPVADHLRVQLWLWGKTKELGFHYEVWELGLTITATPRGVRGARMEGDWVRIGSCDKYGRPLVGRERWARWIWTLCPPESA